MVKLSYCHIVKLLIGNIKMKLGKHEIRYTLYDIRRRLGGLVMFGLAVFVFTFHFSLFTVWAEDCNLSCLEVKINDLDHARELSEAATKPLEGEVAKLQASVKSIGGQLDKAEKDLEELEVSVAKREKDLAGSYAVLSMRVKEYYKRSRISPPFLVLFSRKDASLATRDLAYRAAVTEEDREVITQTTEDILKLEADAKKIKEDSVKLAGLRQRLDAQAKFFQVEIDKAKAYQATLSTQIKELTKRQQEILSAKAGTFSTTVGDVPPADDPASRPDYSPGFSPAFAAFSFGAPHYKGMSQYGAFGRAKNGQNYEQILKAYYGDGIEIKDHNPDAQISVDGYGSYSLEEYAKRIYEMPGSWGDEGGMEALKAQAIAARSYALARGGSICATEACQVFKPNPKGGNWEKAVNDTRGKVVYANGQPFSTWYASTSGGYQVSYSAQGHSTPGFWDTKNGRSGWTDEAYEKLAGSPWFYKAWYRERSGDSCGRSHPWLTSEEMADILNAWVVLFEGKGDSARVTPLGSCWGGNPYSIGDLQSVGGYTSVSGVSVTYAENGVTASVTFQTNKGSTPAINGADFKKAFNLRASGRVALKSGLFNIEKK